MKWPFGRMSKTGLPMQVRIIARLDLDRYGMDAKVQRELKRYLLLRFLWKRRITMQSKEVDELWHKFILDTKRYREFCNSVYGEYLDHESSHFELDKDFESGYELLFGATPPGIWTVAEAKKDFPPDYDFNCA